MENKVENNDEANENKTNNTDGGRSANSGGEEEKEDNDDRMTVENEDVVNEGTINPKGSEQNANNTPLSTPPRNTPTPSPIQTPTQMSSTTVNEALKCIQSHCQTEVVSVNNTMWLYLWPVYVNENDNLVISMVDCNWNVWDEKLGLEITLNILNNADGKKTLLHAPSAGHDMTILMAHAYKVCLCNYLHFVFFYRLPSSSIIFLASYFRRSRLFLLYSINQPLNHPKTDIATTRTATHINISTHNISHRPSENHSATWGRTMLEEYKKYLNTNARTIDGQAFIAHTNGVSNEWNEMVSSYNHDTPVAKKCYDLAVLVAKKGNNCFAHIGMNEGLHRGGAAIQALTGSKIDTETGAINAACNLSYSTFEEVGLMTNDDIPVDSNFQDMVETTLIGECAYFDTILNVSVHWISSTIEEVDIESVLSAFKCNSRQISDNKLTSARKSSWVQIGETARSFLNSVTLNSLNHTPKTEGRVFSQTIIANKIKAIKKIYQEEQKRAEVVGENQNHICVDAFGVYSFLYQDAFNEYCKNPFSIENENNVIEHFTFPAVLDENVTLTLPYVNSHKGLLQDPIDSSQLNTWTINAVYLLPKVIHYLWADRMNTTLLDAASSSECQQLSSYASCFHSNNFGMSCIQCHGAMAHFYEKLTFRTFALAFPNDIISAALFIVDTVNTALTHPTEWRKSTKKMPNNDLLTHMKQEGKGLEIIYSSIKSDRKVNDVIYNLGK